MADIDRSNRNVVRRGAGWWCRIHRIWTGEQGWCPMCARSVTADDNGEGAM